MGDMLCVTKFEVHTDGVASGDRLLVTVFGWQALGDRLCVSVMYVVCRQRLTLFIVRTLFMTSTLGIDTVHNQSTAYDCKDRD